MVKLLQILCQTYLYILRYLQNPFSPILLNFGLDLILPCDLWLLVYNAILESLAKSFDQWSYAPRNFGLPFFSWFLFNALKESAEDENMKTVVKTRRPGQGPVKQQKTAKTSEESSSTSDKKKTGQDAVESATQVPCLDSASLPQKPPNRRKMSLKKSLQERAKPSETTHDKPHSYELPSDHELLKVEL